MIFFAMVVFLLFSEGFLFSENLFNFNQQYEDLIEDLSNYETSGYKPSYDNFFQNGRLLRTGNILDLGLVGEGYFKVIENNMTYYTRNSFFLLDVEKNIIKVDGKKLMSLTQYMNTVDWNTLNISDSGKISAINLSDKKMIQIGKIDIFSLNQPEKHSSIYFTSKSNPTKNVLSRIQSGFVELSRVDVNILEVLIITRLHEIRSEIGESEFGRLIDVQKIIFSQIRSLKENQHLENQIFYLLKINSNYQINLIQKDNLIKEKNLKYIELASGNSRFFENNFQILKGQERIVLRTKTGNFIKYTFIYQKQGIVIHVFHFVEDLVSAYYYTFDVDAFINQPILGSYKDFEVFNNNFEKSIEEIIIN